MDPDAFAEEFTERNISIVGSELVENYTVYVIEVRVGAHQWTVKHRYSDFHDLHEKLTAEKKVESHLLPPKKMLGKNSRTLVEKRQKELEVYLQTLLVQFPTSTPKDFACFLHFNLYEGNGITAALAETLFHRGEQLLSAGEVFAIRPLQLHSVSQQLRLATPTCWTGDARTDLGHILDFTCRLRYLKIQGTQGPVGTSNIQETRLPFDLSIFKSLVHIEISECSTQQISGLPCLRSSLETLSIHNSVDTMLAVLVPESREFTQWDAEGAEPAQGAGPVIPLWSKLTTLDMSHNLISTVDSSVTLVRKVEFLDLSHNKLVSLDNLQNLYNLVHVDLSYNCLSVLESLHTKLGNIKTLCLAANQLVSLASLSRLYSLVNLDLSHNQLAQLEEVAHIGGLPCLEKVCLSGNPMCIIPDYRTKVLAQFWDRAPEVCLDGMLTTEKELDTVEVLKAIQKAKEVKGRMASSDQKISEESRLPAAAPPPLSSSPSRSSSSSPPASCQEVNTTEREGQPPTSLQAPSPTCLTATQTFVPDPMAQPADILSDPSNKLQSHTSSGVAGGAEEFSLRPCPPVLSFHLTPYSSNKDFITQLSLRLHSSLQEEETGERKEEQESCPNPTQEETHLESPGPSPGSRDGYFEMGRDDSCPTPPPAPLLEEAQQEETGERMQPETEEEVQPEIEEEAQPETEEEVGVSRTLWCFCIRVEEAVEQREAVLVLTDRQLGLFFISPNSSSANQHTGFEEVLSSLQTDFLLPYRDIILFSAGDLPESCLALGLQTGPTRWYLFSQRQHLNSARMQLAALIHAQHLNSARMQLAALIHAQPTHNPQRFLHWLLSSWELEEDQEVDGGWPAHLLLSSSSSSPLPLLEEVLTAGSPALLFLTSRHLCVMKVDFLSLADSQRRFSDLQSSSSSSPPWWRLVRVPLGSVAPVSRQMDSHRHVLGLLLGQWKVLVVFPVAQDRLSFLEDLTSRRRSLDGLRILAVPRVPQHGDTRTTGSDQMTSSFFGEDQPPRHLFSSLCPGQRILAGLSPDKLLAFLQEHVAEGEGEEVRQVLWLSVVLYKFPEVEVTSCLLLSTNAIYFLLEDCASTLGHLWDITDATDTEVCPLTCLSVRMSKLLSVNVGLMDQYFRVVGPSPDQVMCCLSRDSFGTASFLQEVMSALSLRKPPPAQPSEQDFYSQFTHTHTGQVQNYELLHSSRVKFVYPSEEEMGDLTFIVAERKTPACSTASSSFNILLYLLVFQVEVPSSPGSPNPAYTGQASCPVLQPRTLILTSTDIFLLDEDYVSYPLPDFAKEPPSRERYLLREARRIRDLDRVLLGYQTYPQALTLVFDDLPGPDLLCHMTQDHFAARETAPPVAGAGSAAAAEVQWCIYVPAADSRERLIGLLARQWEMLCSRELPVELTG